MCICIYTCTCTCVHVVFFLLYFIDSSVGFKQAPSILIANADDPVMTLSVSCPTVVIGTFRRLPIPSEEYTPTTGESNCFSQTLSPTKMINGREGREREVKERETIKINNNT